MEKDRVLNKAGPQNGHTRYFGPFFMAIILMLSGCGIFQDQSEVHSARLFGHVENHQAKPIFISAYLNDILDNVVLSDERGYFEIQVSDRNPEVMVKLVAEIDDQNLLIALLGNLQGLLDLKKNNFVDSDILPELNMNLLDTVRAAHMEHLNQGVITRQGKLEELRQTLNQHLLDSPNWIFDDTALLKAIIDYNLPIPEGITNTELFTKSEYRDIYTDLVQTYKIYIALSDNQLFVNSAISKHLWTLPYDEQDFAGQTFYGFDGSYFLEFNTDFTGRRIGYSQFENFTWYLLHGELIVEFIDSASLSSLKLTKFEGSSNGRLITQIEEYSAEGVAMFRNTLDLRTIGDPLTEDIVTGSFLYLLQPMQIVRYNRNPNTGSGDNATFVWHIADGILTRIVTAGQQTHTETVWRLTRSDENVLYTIRKWQQNIGNETFDYTQTEPLHRIIPFTHQQVPGEYRNLYGQTIQLDANGSGKKNDGGLKTTLHWQLDEQGTLILDVDDGSRQQIYLLAGSTNDFWQTAIYRFDTTDFIRDTLRRN